MRRLLESTITTAESLGDGSQNWNGMRVVAIDKVSLKLPDYPQLCKKFGYHKGNHNLGSIGVEMAVLFATGLRIPVAYKIGKVYTSDETLFSGLTDKVMKNDLVLIDNGFYSVDIFSEITDAGASFVCPANKCATPVMVKKIADGDYISTIRRAAKDGKPEKVITVRVIFAHRDGFKRRRIVTSLLDPIKYPKEQIVEVYHERWHIETFYRDFKVTMAGNSWHCQTPENFERELCAKLMVACLIRIAGWRAASKRGVKPGVISFSKALTRTRIFFRTISGSRDPVDFSDAYQELVDGCAKGLVNSKPGRSFSRDRQEYRKKSRGLVKKRRGRPRKHVYVPEIKPETDTRMKGTVVLIG
ncbi:MAG: IS4 family transposase, partial [Patescibacteria group bacterium]